jgi:hypothetical protein
MHGKDAQSNPVKGRPPGSIASVRAHSAGTYHRVLDGRKHPIRGTANDHYYARPRDDG